LPVKVHIHAVATKRRVCSALFHPTEVNRIERGRRNPGLLTIVKLAKALGIPASDLLAGL
jgi:transcriptional regulator with XRE-family HTH domain